MKVKYIGDFYRVSLRKGKIYNVEKVVQGWYSIIDESGEAYCFNPKHFEIVEK